MKNLVGIGFLFSILTSVACEAPPAPPPTEKQIQASKARAAANSLNFTENAEIDNIKSRLELTSNPGQMGFVVLLNQSGQPIKYTSVKGKITSSGKRLTPTVDLQKLGDGAGHWTYEVVPGPSDEGTYGSSDPYIYFWTTDGTYIQWSGEYLYSDKPIRLSVKPLVVEVNDGTED